MLGERLSGWFGTEHSGVVRDVLSGKERIIRLADLRCYPCRTLSACHFAALNFVRTSFRHMQRTRGNASSSMARWLSGITERRVLEGVLSPCEQLTGRQAVQLEEMYHVPLFEGELNHVATKRGPSSMILFKQSLRQMQLYASPISAMIVSRNTSATVCLKIREHSKDVFLVLDFALASPQHSHPSLALVINTSLEQTAARLSGNLPVDNHLVTRDRQWQAQLFTSCTISIYTPADGAALLPESLVMHESVALLRAMGEIDDDGGQELESGMDRGRLREAGRDRNRTRTECQGERQQYPGSSHGATRERTRTPLDLGGVASTSNRSQQASHMRGASMRQRTATGVAGELSLPYEQTKRHCRIFLSGDELSPPLNTRPSHNSRSSEISDEEARFECVICFEDIPEEEGIHLAPCAHGFCRSCLAGHVCSKLEERRFPVFCPLCMAERENASPSVVSESLVQRLGVSEAHHTIWLELEMAHLCVRIHCHRCDRTAFVDKEEYEQQEQLSCPFPGCRHTWCKNCQQSLSEEGPKHSCDGTEELDYLVKQMGWKYCPKCRTPVQKNGGCNHMRCAMPGCNTHFCYRCGKQITRTSIPFLVRTAVNAHFKHCTL